MEIHLMDPPIQLVSSELPLAADFLAFSNVRFLISQKEVAGPNQTNPAILGMVGLGLHLSDQRAARILKVRATLESGVEHSLVSGPAIHSFSLTTPFPNQRLKVQVYIMTSLAFVK